jgi:hypothetical protein
MSALARMQDPSVRRSIEDEIERLISMLDFVEPDQDLKPWLAGGIEVVGTDDREEDDCDLEDGHDAEPDQCDGETDTWENDPQSQEVPVSL